MPDQSTAQLSLFDAIPQEEWRPLATYEGIYEISNLGRIRCLISAARWKAGRFLSGKIQVKGYRTVALGFRVKKDCLLHRLVAATFIGPCPEGMQVNHIDGDKLNNRVDNLEYVTPKQNIDHAVRIGKIDWHTHGKLTIEEVRELRTLRHLPRKVIAKRFGITHGHVTAILRRAFWDDI